MTDETAQQPDVYETFVNPYTFIPFPRLEKPEEFRSEPAGHGRLGARRYSGWIDVELTARSPLLVRGAHSGDEGRFPRRTVGGEKVPFLPGSSLAGVVRSLYEVLAGGCLRVFGEDFVPGYRQAAHTESGWTLARIETVENGRPKNLRLCKPVVWVKAEALAARLRSKEEVAAGLDGAEKVRSAATLQVDPAGAGGTLRDELTDESRIEPGEDWVMLVTDSGTRTRSYWCAVGQLSDTYAELSDEAWKNYQLAVVGTDDVRRARNDGTLNDDGPVESPVYFRKKGDNRRRLIGYRHEARQRLFPDQVVWVRTKTVEKLVSVGGEKPAPVTKEVVEQLSLSQVWRHAGTGAAGERVPDALLPCPPEEHDGRLCPACRVFGSADTSEKRSQDNRQVSYRGHVRFGEALPQKPVPEVHSNVLPPLGAPRPGAGQFYLRTGPAFKPRPDAWALRKWGSYPDQDDSAPPRQLRGRKTYWLTERHEDRPLFRVENRVWKDNKMASTGESVAAGTVFRYRVHIEGLSPAETGGLLASLDPGLVLGHNGKHIGFAVGGGRPLGYGSCTGRVAGMHLLDARGHYAGLAGGDGELTRETALAAFRESVDPGVCATWPAAAAALTLDRVEPGNVWYPPSSELPAARDLTVADLAAGFGFWNHSRGEVQETQTLPLVQLPEVDDENQQLPVRPKIHLHPKSDRNNGGRNRRGGPGGRRSGGRK